MVVAPGAADGAGLLEDQKVALAALAQPYRHAESGKATADDGNVCVLKGRGCLLRQLRGCIHGRSSPLLQCLL
jgi:hypothetical protein